MARFLRHPIHRAALTVLACAGVLGYAVPDLLVAGTATSGVLAAAAASGIVVTAWRGIRAARRRRNA